MGPSTNGLSKAGHHALPKAGIVINRLSDGVNAPETFLKHTLAMLKCLSKLVTNQLRTEEILWRPRTISLQSKERESKILEDVTIF